MYIVFDGLCWYMTLYNGMYIVYDDVGWYIMVHYGLLQYFRVYSSIGWYIANSKIMHDPGVQTQYLLHTDRQTEPLSYERCFLRLIK